MTDHSLIKRYMPVVGSDGSHLANVDRVEHMNVVRLTKDETGHHHWIPLDWVAHVDRQVHLDRPSAMVRRQWLNLPPIGNWREALFDERIPLRRR